MKLPILIVGAMEVEVDLFISKLQKRQEKVIAGYHFYQGEIENYPVVIVETQVGLINSAVAITLAIENYHPVCIINQGVAGALRKRNSYQRLSNRKSMFSHDVSQNSL